MRKKHFGNIVRIGAALLLAIMMIVGAACQATVTAATTAATTATATAATVQAAQANASAAPGTPEGSPPGAPPDGQGGGSSAAVTGTAANTADGVTQSLTGKTLASTTTDQNVIKATNGATLTADKLVIQKSGDTSSEDSSNFYGLNAAVLAEAGSTISLSNSSIETNSEGSNGVFSTGEGAVVNVENVTITTTKNSSRGLDVTQGGTLTAKNVTITTSGAHCAAIAADRGGGTETVTGGTMTTSGEGSPGIYSTANITVSDAKLTATGSEAAVVEGKNSITLNNVSLSGAKSNGVMLYQSFSGDAEVGVSTFAMTGGTLTSSEGALFYITNTSSVINLNGANLVNATSTLLSAKADRWGTEGSNGGKVTLNATAQALQGNVLCDKISTVALALQQNSTLQGAIDADNTGTVSLTLDAGSVWTVSADSHLSTLTDADTTMANIHDGGHTITYDATNSLNSWLGGKTITLREGGVLMPE